MNSVDVGWFNLLL